RSRPRRACAAARCARWRDSPTAGTSCGTRSRSSRRGSRAVKLERPRVARVLPACSLCRRHRRPLLDSVAVRRSRKEASMTVRPFATVSAGDVTRRVGVEAIESRGIDVDELIEKLVDAAGAEFTTYYYDTILRMYLAGHEDYKEICEDARLEDRAHFELITPRIYELGGTIPYDIRTFADRAGCPDAYLPGSNNGQYRMDH